MSPKLFCNDNLMFVGTNNTTFITIFSAVNESLGLGSWEDGIMDENSQPFNRSTDTDVYTNCWSNVWEWGHGDMAYKFANADYKVISS